MIFERSSCVNLLERGKNLRPFILTVTKNCDENSERKHRIHF
ncbi:hypothetical protein LEP1GSC016_1353 [Leptospira borgpetersenii serovar Hardjo-bovis str. Sponselee]|uniref:Uncharacterized protein n=1 Tax=Leptospira borgpetersenii serovar Hardjo-bovis str. Sponselee TaxID=1303729 RepID=M6C8E0_LEPBO|nr:hypothetical protein LEP1GSC016_1353 [Leptospira borgpetersenii serovar Hardjo-bovis str. Sponselee]